MIFALQTLGVNEPWQFDTSPTQGWGKVEARLGQGLGQGLGKVGARSGQKARFCQGLGRQGLGKVGARLGQGLGKVQTQSKVRARSGQAKRMKDRIDKKDRGIDLEIDVIHG